MKNITIIVLIIISILLAFFSTVYFSMGYFDNLNTQLTSKKTDEKTDNFFTNKVEVNNNIDVEQNNNFSIKLSFVGDMMLASNKDYTSSDNFNGYVNKKEPTYFLEKVKHVFEEDDFTVANLENVFTDSDLKARTKKGDPAFWFKSKTSNVNILTSSSIEGVSIANNHINDYGKQGKNDTINTLVNANIQYGNSDNIMYFQKNDFIVAVICKGLWIESQISGIIELIKEAEKKSDYQIVFFHGGTESIHQPENWKIRSSRKLIDNGVDLVIGNHPHVLQPREIYKGKEIIYSLGNFCFGGHKRPENRTIIYQMNLTIDSKNNSLLSEESNIIPCYVYTGKSNNYQPDIIVDEKTKNKVIEFMNGKVKSPL